MHEFWSRLLDRPSIGMEAMVATIFVSLLGLAQPLAAINIFNNYLMFGLTGTLLVIASGATLAIVLEAILRQARMRSLRGICDNRDRSLFTRAQNPKLVDKLSTVRKAFGPRSMSDWMDLPTALVFVGVLFFIHWSLALVALVFLSLVYGIGWLSKLNTGEILTDRQQAMKGLFEANPATFDGALEEMIHQDSRTESKQSFLEGLQKMLAALISISVLSLGALLTFNGLITPGELIAANILAARTYMILSKWNAGSENRLIGQVSVGQLRRAATQKGLTISEMKEKVNAA